MQSHPRTPTAPAQPDLPLDHSPQLEPAMRELFDRKWRHWHRCGSYEEAVADPKTRELLYLTVLRQRQHQVTPRRPRRRAPGSAAP